MFRWIVITGTVFALAGAGCVDNSPPPPRVDIPRDAGDGPVRRSDPQKPMPADIARTELAPPAFDDVAIVDQEMPERRPFVDAYTRVGRPLLIIEGWNQADLASNTNDRPVALVFSDWMRCDGAVSITSARGERANPDVAIELAILDTNDRDAVNLSARAVNVSDNLLLGQAMVDMPKPADRGSINRYTRFLARKLMADMTRTWNNAPPPPANALPPQVEPPRPESRPAAPQPTLVPGTAPS